MLALLYLVSHLDRANIGNAKIEGLEASLGMAGVDYNIAVAIFFVPYILFGMCLLTIRLCVIVLTGHDRGSQQFPPHQVQQAISLYWRPCYRMGHRDDIDRRGPELWRSPRYSCLSRSL
jgi:hypothetical protein